MDELKAATSTRSAPLAGWMRWNLELGAAPPATIRARGVRVRRTEAAGTSVDLTATAVFITGAQSEGRDVRRDAAAIARDVSTPVTSMYPLAPEIPPELLFSRAHTTTQLEGHVTRPPVQRSWIEPSRPTGTHESASKGRLASASPSALVTWPYASSAKFTPQGENQTVDQ